MAESWRRRNSVEVSEAMHVLSPDDDAWRLGDRRTHARVALSSLDQAAHCAQAGLVCCRIRLVFLHASNSAHHQPHANPESWLQSHLLGPSLQNAPRQQLPCLFLLFFDTHLNPPSSTHCLLFSYFCPLHFCAKILRHFYIRPHIRVGQEEKDASQEASQGREDPSRPAGQQPEERHRE